MKPGKPSEMSSLRSPRQDESVILDDLASIVPVELLQRMQDSFSAMVDVPILFVSPNGAPITESDDVDAFCWQITRHGEASEPCADCGRLKAASVKDASPGFECPLGIRDVMLPITAGDAAVGYALASPVGPERLADVTSAVSALAGAVSEVASALRENKLNAILDPVTDLPNRVYFWECLSRELEMADSRNYPVSLLLIDLDDFKQINETYGHAEGDEVLRAVGQVLKGEIRSSDMAARYGSDAFLVMLRCSDPTGAEMVAWRLKHKIAGCSITAHGQSVQLSASVGHVTYPICAGRDPDAIFKEAHAALRASSQEDRKAA